MLILQRPLLLHSHGKRTYSTLRYLTLYGETVTLAGEFKYLGVILDSKLNLTIKRRRKTSSGT